MLYHVACFADWALLLKALSIDSHALCQQLQQQVVMNAYARSLHKLKRDFAAPMASVAAVPANHLTPCNRPCTLLCSRTC